MKLLPCSVDYLAALWPDVAPILSRAVERHDGYTVSDVYKAISGNTMQLWVVVNDKNEIKAVCVTQIVVYPQKKSCLLLFVAGTEMSEWVHLKSDIERWASEIGCKDTIGFGREGWKTVKDYKPISVMYQKQL